MGYVERLLAEGERIVFVTRRHWLALLQTILVDLGLTIIIVALALTGALFPVLSPWSFLALVLLLIPILHFVRGFTIWRGQQFIVTTRRAVTVRGVFDKYVSDSSLEMINDVVLQQSFLGRLLDFGNLRIITGSDVGVDTCRGIAHPLQFKAAMLNQKRQVALSGRDVPEVLARLSELRAAGTITDEEFEREKRELLERL